MTGLLPGAQTVPSQPFCRESELADIISAIVEEDCSAVFLTSDSGLGASTILQELVQVAKEHVPVLSVHGSQSLARIPFGVLTPYLSLQETPTEALRMGVLRQMLEAIDARQRQLGAAAAGNGYRPLVVVDDAHAIDEGTAELLVSLVMSGTVSVVASHSKRHRLPDPLPKLWATGRAENIVLQPLSQEQGHRFCEAMLAGPVLPAMSWHYWSTSAGNPLFLHLLLKEALESGRLRSHEGTWVAEYEPQLHGRGLVDAVKGVVRGLSPDAQAALNLVALAEPLAEASLRALVSDQAVQELFDRPLVDYQPSASNLLVLANPIYGQVIREMVPLAQSRVLHERLIGDLSDDGDNKESLLRRVLWAVEVGIEVSDEALLRAAILASKLFQSRTALDLAQQIQGADFQLRASMVKARAKYNLGDYQGAFAQMESLAQEAVNVQDLTFGALLRAATRSALGLPVSALMADARDLRDAGEQLALADPAGEANIRAYSHSRALMVELLALSRDGRYSEMSELVELLAAQQGLPLAAERLNRTMSLMMEAERLTVQGYPEQGAQRAAEAYSVEHSEENDVFFLPESIMLRQLTALLCAGHWAEATGAIDQFSLEDGPIVFSFGGSASVVKGMALARTGALGDALKILRLGIDALRLSDPQQLLGYCTAMAAYCAARLGQRELAAQLLQEHVESTSMFVVLAYERAYLSATRQLLTPDGGGLAELVTQADAAHASQLTMVELNTLVLVLELGDEAIAGRVAEVAADVEGPWAREVGLYAAALHAHDGYGLMQAAESLELSGLLGLAKDAFAAAARLLTLAGLDGEAGSARGKLRRVTQELAEEHSTPRAHLEPIRLTSREKEVTTLAAAGHSDRQIAEHLKLSMRTVEGHLHRSYIKLGIAGRDELKAALSVG